MNAKADCVNPSRFASEEFSPFRHLVTDLKNLPSDTNFPLLVHDLRKKFLVRIPWGLSHLSEFSFCSSDEELSEIAEVIAAAAGTAVWRMAELSGSVADLHAPDWREEFSLDELVLILFAAQRFTRGHDVQPCELSSTQMGSATLVRAAILRMTDTRWWRKRLKTEKVLRIDEFLRDRGLVHRGRNRYASRAAVATMKFRNAQNERFLQDRHALSSDGLEICLADCRGISDPEIRRIELMVRLRGLEERAEELGFETVFLTHSLPSRFHAVRQRSRFRGQKRFFSHCEKNPVFDGSTPRQGNAHSLSVQKAALAAVRRNKMQFFGVRVVEPHHDGTPHTHFLFFVSPGDSDRFAEIWRDFACRDSPEEVEDNPSARLDVKFFGPEDSAVGYLAKYIAKGVDGHSLDNGSDADSVDSEWAGSDAVMAATDIVCWARAHRIRQFQFLGCPPVTVWRELRRLSVSVESASLEQLRAAANEGDFRRFLELMGVAKKRTEYTFLPLYGAGQSLVLQTGEIVERLETRFGDPAKRVLGLCSVALGLEALTRCAIWGVGSEAEVRAAKTIMLGVVDMAGCLSGDSGRGAERPRRNLPIGAEANPAAKRPLGPVEITARGSAKPHFEFTGSRIEEGEKILKTLA